MKRPPYAVLAAALLGVLFAVDARVATRLEVDSDTLVINGLNPVKLDVRAFNWHGMPIWKPHVRVSGMSPTFAHARPDGSVRCKAAGDETLTIAQGPVAKQVLVRCRPIMTFGWHQSASLELGGLPDTLAIEPIGYDRRPVTLLRGQATLRDSTVARLSGNLLYPVRVGCDLVDVAFSGGTSTQVSVCVNRTAIDSSLTLAAGEIRTYRVGAGYYQLTLDAVATRGGRAPLVLAIVRANCAIGREGPQDYYCITNDSSIVIVANRSDPGTGDLSGHLTVRQRPHKWANSPIVAVADPGAAAAGRR